MKPKAWCTGLACGCDNLAIQAENLATVPKVSIFESAPFKLLLEAASRLSGTGGN
ncbi:MULTISPECIES: hypothetical protein [unclassified Nitrobacter]|uniref:hypothetical protein n=1 Tax=unclassified Nitrobacter TaxID=2620411 RepID=UPI001ACE7D7D|nr:MULTISPECIES: hypothetical protein [unclassified Nitrobacter]MBN9149417.1 hypothetical protein [Nitrobacter sp.]